MYIYIYVYIYIWYIVDILLHVNNISPEDSQGCCRSSYDTLSLLMFVLLICYWYIIDMLLISYWNIIDMLLMFYSWLDIIEFFVYIRGHLQQPRPSFSKKDTVQSVHLDPTDPSKRRQLATGSWDGYVKIYDLNSGLCLTNPGMEGHEGKVRTLYVYVYMYICNVYMYICNVYIYIYI